MKYIQIIGLLLLSGILYSQENNKINDTLRNSAINLYLDCYFCDDVFIRDEIQFVNYVRDRKNADVHLIITLQSTGSGGTEYTFTFIGLNKYSSYRDTLTASIKPKSTTEEKRNLQLQYIKLGLISFVAKTPYAELMNISYAKSEELEEPEDKWNSWVFDITATGWFNGEETSNSTYLYSSVNADRITEDWKYRFSVSGNYHENNFNYGDENILSISRGYYFDGSIVKSLGEHWSAGGSFGLVSSSYQNLNYNPYFDPTIEYNVFKYSESTHKQLRLKYQIGYGFKNYIDTTIYNKIEEHLFQQELGVAFEMKEQWGSISSSLDGMHYFHDVSLNRLSFRTSLRLIIVKGLSIRISGNIAMIHNQISLPKGDVSLEDLLLQQRQMETNYSYWGSVGISYTFGSIYNNVVNPRFGY